MTATVLLHPIGLDSATWWLMDVPDVVAVDLPGHGNATALDGFGLEQVADVVVGQLPDRFHLVGISMGGMVAQHIAVRHPDRVASLVLACCSGAGNPDVLYDRAALVERLGMAGIADDYLARWFTPELLAGDAHPAVEYARSRLLADDPAVIASYWRAMAKHDLLEQLKTLDTPTMVVGGVNDTSVALGSMRALSDLVPRGEFRAVDGPHMLQLETPHLLSQAVREHLQMAGSAA